jgi:hypothetical protein
MSLFEGPLRVSPINPRYFTDDRGEAIYLTGSHTWAVMQDMWLEGTPRRNMDYSGFLQMLDDYGHNFLRFWQWMHTKNAGWSETPTCFDPQPFARTGPGVANDGLPKFDLSIWNEAYFTRLRERVEQAGARGIYTGVMLFEAWTIKESGPKTDPWIHHPMNPANNVNGVTDNPVVENGRAWNVFSLNCPQILAWQKEYVRKVVDTLNDLDHVLWEICNEIPHNREAMEWSEHLTGFIHEYERGKPKQHPVGITAEGGDQDNAELFATCADWISPSTGRLFEYRYSPPPADGSKVILTDTDHLWGIGCEVGWIWKSFTRGMNVLFMDPWEPIPDDMDWWFKNSLSLNRRYYHVWDPVRRNLGYTRRFALRMNLNASAPHGELCTSGYCLAQPGETYLCFFPEGGYGGMDLWEAEGRFAVEWFNPMTGEPFDGGTVEGGNRHALSAPFTGASVLFLQRVTESS